MRLLAAVGFGFGLLGGIAAANAADCPGNPGAMGTSRVMTIDPREYPRLGTVQYQETLPLAEKEVVLTFDDGPMPPYTNRILEVLAHECVKANYFIIGRMARGYPDLLRRIRTEGHVIGTHSENHPLAFERMPQRVVESEIEQGFASVAAALGDRAAVAPFFRIPGLLRAEGVENYLRSRGRVTWSADVVADDWQHISASEVVKRALSRLDARGKGILLLHDIQPATALALPHLLRELKRRGYKIVQVAPAAAPVPVASAPRQHAPAAAKPQLEIVAAPRPTTAPPAAVAATAPPQSPADLMSAIGALPDTATRKPAEKPADAPSETASAHAGAPPVGPSAPTARPLTSTIKPSHSASPSAKVTEMPVERQPADPWMTRADVAPASRSRPWPVTASSLTHALPR